MLTINRIDMKEIDKYVKIHEKRFLDELRAV